MEEIKATVVKIHADVHADLLKYREHLPIKPTLTALVDHALKAWLAQQAENEALSRR